MINDRKAEDAKMGGCKTMTYCIFVCLFLFFIPLSIVHIWSKVDW